MDNDKLSQVPVSELTPENFNSLKSGEPSHKIRQRPKNNKLPLLIAGVVLLIGVGIALFFIFRKPADSPSENPNETADAELEAIWAPTEGTEDPGAEYVAHHEETLNNPTATDDEKLEAKISIANHYTVTGRYDEAEALLGDINRDILTNRQLFNLYSSYAYLYSTKNDEAAYNTYSALVEEVLNSYWDEEIPTALPEPEENSEEAE